MIQSATSSPKTKLRAGYLYKARVAPMNGVKAKMASRRQTPEQVVNGLREAEFAISRVAQWLRPTPYWSDLVVLLRCSSESR